MNTQMTNIQKHIGNRGFTLIEALVGVVVLSVGLLAIASLQTGTMTATGESKARSEAMQIAEAQMEYLRGWYSNRTEFNILGNTFDDQSVTLESTNTQLPDGTSIDTIGTNAEYTIEWQVDVAATDDSGDPLLYLAGVRVAWQAATDSAGEEQAVSVASFINWDSPVGGAAATDAGDPNGGGNLISPPTGRAFQGGRVYQDAEGNLDLPDGATSNTVQIGDATPLADGTYTYTAEDGATELIGADGRVLLTIPTGESFSTISGMFYSNIDLAANEFDIIASDASSCVRPYVVNGDPDAYGITDYPVEEYYRCYVGPAWYGNVGVVRYGNVQTNDKVCVGRPGESENATRWDSLHPFASAVRSYRGFEETNDPDNPISIGIGVNPENDDDYDPTNYEDHDFLLSKLTGQSTCSNALEVNPELYEDSWGQGFCFTGSILGETEAERGYCPNVRDEVVQDERTISVTIQTNVNNFAAPQNNGFEAGYTLADVLSIDQGNCVVVSEKNPIQVNCTTSTGGTGGLDTWGVDLMFDHLADTVTLCNAAYNPTPSEGSISVTDSVVTLSDLPLSESSVGIEASIEESCP